MDQFLGFVLALLAFAFFVFLVGKAVKFVIVAGCVLLVYFALLVLGVIG